MRWCIIMRRQSPADAAPAPKSRDPATAYQKWEALPSARPGARALLDRRDTRAITCRFTGSPRHPLRLLPRAPISQEHNITYTTMAYTRPDIYYSRPIPTPAQMSPEAVYTNAVINNAMSDVMMLGPFRKVMTFLQTLRFLTTGKIVPGAYGFEAKQMRS